MIALESDPSDPLQLSILNQSLMCHRKPNEDVLIETASKQVKNYYKLVDIDVSAIVKLEQYIKDMMKGSV